MRSGTVGCGTVAIRSGVVRWGKVGLGVVRSGQVSFLRERRMPRQREVTLTEKPIQEVNIELEGTAPMLIGHPLPWDIGSYWDNQAAEAGKQKVKRPTAEQLSLLAAITGNGFSLPVASYDAARGVNGYQESILRGHWLPDHGAAFPVSGFLGAITKGAVQYGGKNYNLPAVKLRALTLFGDRSNTVLARIQTGGVAFDEDIGPDAGRGSPRHIIRIRYDLPWSTIIRVRFSPALLAVEGILQAFAWGGDFGVGQRRPSSPHGGQYGTFKVKSGPTAEVA